MIGGVGWYRKDFTLPEASKALEWVGALRVGQLPLARVAQRHARSAPTPAPTCRSSCGSRASSGAAPTGWWSASTRGAAATDFPPVRPHRRRAPDRRLVELLRASSARSTCERLDTVDWKARAGASRGCRARAAPRRSGAARPAQRRRAAASACASPAASARSGLNLGSATSPAEATRSFTTTIRVPGAKLWSPRGPYLYPVKLARVGGRAHGRQLPAADRHPLGPRRGRRPPAAQRQRVQPARRRRARGRPRRRASRSTTRSAAGSSPRSRRWARR